MYAVRFHYLASARIIVIDDSLKIDLRIIGWKKQIDLINQLFKRKTGKITQKQYKNSKSKLSRLSLIRSILKSFKVNKCYLDIDTGNMQLNGILYPVFYWISKYTGKPIGINFQNQTEIIVEIQNNCARVIRAFIYSSFKNKNHGKLR